VPLLQVRDLGKSFGGVKAVDGVSFDLAAGELLALIGPNGAGKSTTFNMVNGQLPADRGSILLGGEELVGRAPRDIWRLGVGRTFQIAETFASLTVVENVQMALLSHDAKLFAMWRRAAGHRRREALALLDQVGMQSQADRPCSELAYGDVKRVELAIALANSPRLLLMDEPTAGMAPNERNELMALTKQLVTDRGMAVLFTEHSMDVVFTYADRMIVLARGRLIAQGKPADVREDPKVQAVYFGSGKTFGTSAGKAAELVSSQNKP
jgi:branched-chain amino acid transport system ATP-binding protein